MGSSAELENAQNVLSENFTVTVELPAVHQRKTSCRSQGTLWAGWVTPRVGGRAALREASSPLAQHCLSVKCMKYQDSAVFTLVCPQCMCHIKLLAM